MTKLDSFFSDLIDSATQLRAMDVALYRLGERISENGADPAVELFKFFTANSIGKQLSDVSENIILALEDIYLYKEELSAAIDEKTASKLRAYNIDSY